MKLVTDMIAVVLSRVAANKFSAMEHRPVISDILCILRYFVVPAGKIKFSPLPRSVILQLRSICFSTIPIINDIVLKHTERNRKITLFGRGKKFDLGRAV